MNIRIKYSITGPLCFLSHLETVRLWQRAFLRSKLPIAWSNGFNPRPRISPGPARNVGIEGLGEYVDAKLTEYIKPEKVFHELFRVMPGGIEILAVKELPEQHRTLEKFIEESVYQIVFAKGVPLNLSQNIRTFMDEESHFITRVSPKGEKELDARSFVTGCEINNDCLYVSLKTGTGGSLRIAELLTVLCDWDIMSTTIRRIGLYGCENGKRLEP